MSRAFDEFKSRRKRGNELLLDTESLALKRFVALDKQIYADGALPGKDKELLGLVASMVLRCNDCIDYHIDQSIQAGWGKAQIDEAIAVAMMVGGSIVIPHARHAAETVNALLNKA